MEVTRKSKAWTKAVPAFKPEPGSPAHGRSHLFTNEQGDPAKAHWEGSKCVHVTVKRYRVLCEERIFDGSFFDEVPEAYRCKACHVQFVEA